MKVALIYPPTCDPTAPYLAVPMLTGFLRRAGVTVVPIDANIEAYDHWLRPAPLAGARDKIEAQIARLESQPQLSHTDQLLYTRLWDARGDAHAVPSGIEQAVRTLRDRKAFLDVQAYSRAVDTIEASLRVISAAFSPTMIDFTAYRTPFSLTSPEEIASDASPQRDPFAAYVNEVLIPRLAREQPQMVGLSVCFPGQVQPAYSFALKIKAALPHIHLTVGGPAITQLLIRQKGPDLQAALGPFDTAVVFEGEDTLLRMCEAFDAGVANNKTWSTINNVVHRDPLLGAKYRPGEASVDMRSLPAPDFDGFPLDLYLTPQLVLPYDPTRGCYWGKCTFCHYGLAEVGTASYRERGVQTCVEHLNGLAAKYGTNTFYLSQDSVAPKTLVKLAEGLKEAHTPLRWATDLKAEKYLTPERARILREGGAVACALGVETGNQRVLSLIDKGAPVTVVGDVIENLAEAGIAAEAMCFTGFPTETYEEALDTVRFLDAHRSSVAAFIVGEFDLTHGALVAQAPANFGITDVWQVKGDRFGTGLFYEEQTPPKSDDEVVALDEAVETFSAKWLLRRYPWAGSLSTAHTILYYEAFGPDVFRRFAGQGQGGILGAEPLVFEAAFDLDEASEAASDEGAVWHTLVREKRQVSPEDYAALLQDLPRLERKPQQYRVAAGHPPQKVKLRHGPNRGRRPNHAVNRMKSGS